MSDARSVQPGTAPVTRAVTPYTLGDLIRTVDSRRHLILRTMFAILALVAAALLFAPTLYSASAKLIIDTQKNNVADQAAVISALPTDAPSLQNQIQILYSRDLATEVIARLRLYDDPEFNRRLKSGAFEGLDPRNWFRRDENNDPDRVADAVVDAFVSHLSVDALGLSTSIAVSFTSRDPAKAALVANAIADTYVEDQLRAKREITEKTATWLVARIRELGREVQAAESAAQQFKQANNLSEAADGTPLIDQQLAAVTSQLVLARTDLAQKESTNARVAALAASGNTAELSQVVSSPLIVQLRGQEADLIRSKSLLSARYGERNPKMIAIETQQRDLEDKISSEIKRIADSVASDVAVARTQLGSLSENLAQTERQAQAENLLRVKLRAMEANATSTRTTYDLFVTRLREIQGQEGIQTPDARVISHAAVPLAPSTPSRTLLLAAAIPAGLLFGLLLALVAERTAPTGVPARAVVPVLAQQPLRAAVPPPVLADIPNAWDRNASNVIVDWPHSAFALAISGLLRRLAPRPGASRFLVVTCANGSNSAIAIALARAAALAGARVVLIDGDLRKPILSVAMGLAPPSSGLVEVLSGEVPLSRALQMDPRSSALVLPATRPVPDSTALFSSGLFSQLASHLKRSCDLVLVHARMEDAAALASLADAALLIVPRARAHRPEIFGDVQNFSRLGAKAGVILAG